MQDGAYTSADFNWHPTFGDGPAMVRELRSMHIRTVLHVNSRPFSEETTRIGLAEGWLRKQGHETVVRVGVPQAEERYRQLIAARNSEGIGCWLQDHGDRLSGEILPGVPSRNLFGAMWARATTATGSDTGDPSRIVFTRGAGIGGQRHCIVWSGDTRVGIDFFEEDLWFMINAGLAGYPLSSCDLGGYMFAHKQAAPYNVAFDPDNLARRLCQCLFFMPTPRTQDDAVFPPKFPWNCPPAIERLYGEFLRLRYRMIPYHFSYLVHAARTGEPIVRPLVYHHRDDRASWTIHDQLYVGQWLMVAPILKKGAEHRAVYLPPGRWIDFWTGAQHAGPTMVLAPAPLDRVEGLPVFVRAGAILPTQAPVDHLSDDPPGEIWLDVYPHGASEFVLNDAMELASRITCQHQADEVRLTIDNALPVGRTFHVRVHGVPAPTLLVVNGRKIASGGGAPGAPLTATLTTPPAPHQARSSTTRA
jgi:alpha-glucosidase (family GH31 glycosyl hydrolase)